MPSKILPKDNEILQRALKLLKVEEWTRGIELYKKLGKLSNSSKRLRLIDPRIESKMITGDHLPYRVYRLRSK